MVYSPAVEAWTLVCLPAAIPDEAGAGVPLANTVPDDVAATPNLRCHVGQKDWIGLFWGIRGKYWRKQNRRDKLTKTESVTPSSPGRRVECACAQGATVGSTTRHTPLFLCSYILRQDISSYNRRSIISKISWCWSI